MIALATLVALALVDGVLAGLRAGLGRTGLVDHRAADRARLRRGLGLVVALSVPVVAWVGVDVVVVGEPLKTYAAPARTMLLVLVPYAVILLLGLAVYALLSWQLKYLASAAILGPFTFVRPYLAIFAAVLGLWRHPSLPAGVAAVLAVGAVLLVEPLAGLRWRRPRAHDHPSATVVPAASRPV